MQSVCELLNLIGIAQDVDSLCLTRLQDVVALNNLPDAFLQFREGGVFSLDLRGVRDLDAFLMRGQDRFTSEVKLLLVKLNARANGLSV